MTNDFYGRTAPQLAHRNYTVIPIAPGTKRSLDTGWTTKDVRPINVERDANRYANHGVGLRHDNTVCVDVDVLNADAAQKVTDLVTEHFFCDGGEIPLRIGKAPKVGLFFKCDAPFGKITTAEFRSPEGEKCQVEFRSGNGLQTVVFGIHPDTGAPYAWPNKSLLDVDRDDLIEITRDDAG